MSSLLPAFCLLQPPPPPSLGAASRKPNPCVALHRRWTLQWPTTFDSPAARFRTIARSDGRRCLISLATSAAASGDSDGSRRLSADDVRKLFDRFPQQVKNFPWVGVLWSFQSIILELVGAVVKYLGVPLLAVTSLSEMSYCAHERKMGVIPIPFIVGFALAGVLKDAAETFSSELKEGWTPWHLFVLGSFFTLLKLPGPYYPYWGRLLIPHFANGGLWRTVWLIFTWYRRPNVTSEASL